MGLDSSILQDGFLLEADARALASSGATLEQWAPFVRYPVEGLLETFFPGATQPLPSGLTACAPGKGTLCIQIRNRRIVVDPACSVADFVPDLILVTHAHWDHVAALAEMCAANPSAQVILTGETARLLNILEPSLAALLDRQALEISAEGVARTFRDVAVTAYPAGHILGACMYDIALEEVSVRITGDFSLRPVGGIYGTLPVRPVSAVFMSASHAWHPHSSASASYLHEQIAVAVEGYIERHGLPVSIAGNRLGECQEAYIAIIEAKKRGALRDVPVAWHPEIAQLARWYQEQPTGRFSPWRLPVEASGRQHKGIEIIPIGAQRIDSQAGWLAPAIPGMSPGPSQYPVSTHAAFGELVTLALASQASAIVLYHGAALARSPLAHLLRQTGRDVMQLGPNLTTI